MSCHFSPPAGASTPAADVGPAVAEPAAGPCYAAPVDASTALSPRLKLWVEANGKLVMSDYRVRLLRLIAESGSLAYAAEQLHLSYRRAWGKVKELEANLGVALVESAVGGAGGGHTTLTAEAAALVAAYDRFQERVATLVQETFDEAFGGSPLGANTNTRSPASEG